MPPAPIIFRVEEFAEHAARAEPPHVSYRQAEPATRSPPPRPAFLFGPVDSFLARQFYGQTALRPAGCYILRDAMAGPNGVAIKDGVAFCANALNHHRPYVQTVARRLNTETLPIRDVPGPVVSLLGPSYEVYGHTIVDYMPRLWLLTACGFDPAALKFLVPMRPPAWTIALLLAAGLRQDQLVPCLFSDELIRTDELILPTTLRSYERLSRSFTPATRFWTERLRAGLPPSTRTPSRIFISRSGHAGRMLENRDEVEAEALRQGFTLVQPEKLSLADQVALFAGAVQIMGEYGSGLHNAVFARPGTLTCALRGTKRDPGCIQTGLAHALGQRTGYVFAHTQGEGPKQTLRIEPQHMRLAFDIMNRHFDKTSSCMPPP